MHPEFRALNPELTTPRSPPATPPLSPLPPVSPLPSIRSALFALFPAHRPPSNPFTFWRLRTLSRHNGGGIHSQSIKMNQKTSNSCSTNDSSRCQHRTATARRRGRRPVPLGVNATRLAQGAVSTFFVRRRHRHLRSSSEAPSWT